jgi:hypothetical protein
MLIIFLNIRVFHVYYLNSFFKERKKMYFYSQTSMYKYTTIVKLFAISQSPRGIQWSTYYKHQKGVDDAPSL